MATILYRASVPAAATTGASTSKGSALTNGEIDQNFKNLDSAVLAIGSSSSSTDTSGNTLVIRNAGSFSANTVTAKLVGDVTGDVYASDGTTKILENGTGANASFTGSVTGNVTGTSSKATNLVGGNNTTLLGSIGYQSNTDTTTLLGPNTTANKRFLVQTGTGTNGAAPAWAAILDADVPNLTGKTYNALTLTANATGFTVSGGTTAVATTFAGGAAYTISGTNAATYTLPSATSTLVSVAGSEALTGKTYNRLTITAPATGSTLTIIDGKTLTANNTVTLSGTDGSTLNISTGGTLGTAAFTAATAYQTSQSVTGIVKSSGTTRSAATAGTDYVAPATATNFTATQTFTGSTTVISSKFINSVEAITLSATAATGTINYDVTSQSVLYYTTAATANFTVNFRGNATPTTLNSLMAIGETITVVFLVTTGANAFYNNAVTVDGTAVTPRWQGGTAPTAGNISSVDAYSYTIVKTAAATFSVFASQVQFK
jgi:hypothetical protein